MHPVAKINRSRIAVGEAEINFSEPGQNIRSYKPSASVCRFCCTNGGRAKLS